MAGVPKQHKRPVIRVMMNLMNSHNETVARQRMRVSANFIVRVIGMIVLAYLGLTIGRAFSGSQPTDLDELATQLLALAGAGLGLLTTPRWTIDLIRERLRYIRSISISELTAIVFGALLGLFFGVLLSVPLSHLPAPFGQLLPIVLASALAYLGAVIFSSRKKEIGDLLRTTRSPSVVLPQFSFDGSAVSRRYLVDTSAIIDGRIASVAATGFIDGTLVIPHFVLNEMQMLADSAEEMRRNRGKRGLEILNNMQKLSAPPVEIVQVEIPAPQQVDDKLIVLARQYQCPIITNDHNLGRVAELQGVKVLNLNQLADAIRAPVITGQDMRVRVRDVGREREQGISFLEDGTMVVIEDARNLIGQEVQIIVTRIFQTQTGRIVFAQLAETEQSTETLKQ
jgi:uncharacterized protein YacL